VPAGELVAVLTVVGGLLAGCGGGAVSYSSGYHPAHVEEVAGSDVMQVAFTRLGADRVGLETTVAQGGGTSTVVPYAAVIYDGQGATWVYAATARRTFVRTPVTVDRIEGDRVVLSAGLDPGTRVATVGAVELYGAELGIEGGH
jgi:multidrug efflux pump subunit AcrA (membrane-fusion protein)